MQIHKMEIIVVDFEGYGVNDFINSCNSNYTVHHFKQETVEMSQDAWYDDNPLNFTNVTYDDALQEFNNRRCRFYPFKKLGDTIKAMHKSLGVAFDIVPLERDGKKYFGAFDVCGVISYIKEDVFTRDFYIIGD